MTDMTGNFISTFFVYTEYGEHSLRILFKMIKKEVGAGSYQPRT